MDMNDMILVSVDDHLCEPPDMFDAHLPAKWRDEAPRILHTDKGDDVWTFNGSIIPNIGLNAVAGRPKEEYGIEPTSFDEIRPGCYNVHERVKDMSAGGVLGSMCFPSFPGFAGRLFAAHPDKAFAADLIRAYNDWHIGEWCGSYPGRFIPMALPMIWSVEECAAEVRRVAELGCHSMTFTENPVPLGEPSFHDTYWDPLWEALVDCDTVLAIHLGSSGQLVVSAPDAPMDVMIHMQPMNTSIAAVGPAVVDRAAALSGPQDRPVGGRLRMGAVLHGPGRQDLRHASPVDRPVLRRPQAQRRVPAQLLDLLHLRPGGSGPAPRDRNQQHLLGDGLPPLRLELARSTRGAGGGVRGPCPTKTSTGSPTSTPWTGSTTTRSRCWTAPSARWER